MEVINALGRRKSAVARVYLSEGTGKITINKKDIKDFFPSAILQYVVKQPLQLLDVAEKYDIKVNLEGGGFTGQSQALRLAIARALVKVNADFDFSQVKFAFFMTDQTVVRQFAPKAMKQGALVIDNSGLYDDDNDYPLIVPEINGSELDLEDKLWASPNSVAIEVSLVLSELNAFGDGFDDVADVVEGGVYGVNFLIIFEGPP